MNRLRALFAALVIAAVPGSASATVKYSVGEDTLNAYLDQTPPVRGSGRQSIYIPSVCWDGWRPRSCRKRLLSGTYTWSVRDISVSISPSGLSFNGRLRANFAGFSYSTRVIGSGSLTIQNERLKFDLETVRVPITFRIPAVGRVTVARVPVEPNASFEEPVGIFAINTAAGDQLSGSLLSPQLTLHDGRISFSGVAVPNR